MSQKLYVVKCRIPLMRYIEMMAEVKITFQTAAHSAWARLRVRVLFSWKNTWGHLCGHVVIQHQPWMAVVHERRPALICLSITATSSATHWGCAPLFHSRKLPTKPSAFQKHACLFEREFSLQLRASWIENTHHANSMQGAVELYGRTRTAVPWAAIWWNALQGNFKHGMRKTISNATW